MVDIGIKLGILLCCLVEMLDDKREAIYRNLLYFFFFAKVQKFTILPEGKRCLIRRKEKVIN